MIERQSETEYTNTALLDRCKKGGITDYNSPGYDGKAGCDPLNEIICSTEEDMGVLVKLVKGKDFTEICRRNALRILTNLSENVGGDSVIDQISLLRKISDDKLEEDDLRCLAYEDYRYLKIKVFGGLTKEELARERELSEKETSLRMKWLRYMRD